MWATFIIIKKTAQSNTRPLGENSSNLVTLLGAERTKAKISMRDHNASKLNLRLASPKKNFLAEKQYLSGRKP
jgi:hypothetical protein